MRPRRSDGRADVSARWSDTASETRQVAIPRPTRFTSSFPREVPGWDAFEGWHEATVALVAPRDTVWGPPVPREPRVV